MLKVYTDLASNEPVNPGPPSSIWRTDAHLEVIGQSTGQWLFVGTENKLLIEQIFRVFSNVTTQRRRDCATSGDPRISS